MAEVLERTFIYKYRSDSDFTLDELFHSYIFFSGRDHLNDPFDCFPALLKSNPKSDNVRRFIVNELTQSFPMLKGKHFQEIVQNTINGLTSGDSYLRHVNSLIDQLSNQIGISCFTTLPDNLMMWSHYANFHRGVCLKFDISRDSLFFDDISEVKYTDKFKPKEVDLERGKEVENFRNLFLTKSEAWKSEKELRLIRVKSGKYPIKPNALVAIIFGIKITDKFRRDIINSTQKNYPYLEYYQAKPYSDSFDLRFDKLTNPTKGSALL